MINPDDLVGKTLGRWNLAKRLGEGAMGPVFEASSTGRTAGALHLVRAELVATPDKLERLRRDAKTFQKVEHANVPRLLDVDEADGHFFLVFELIAGRSLQFRLDNKNPLVAAEARHLASDLLTALAALHDRGIVHGDVKPANILTGAEGYWKLTGFSLASEERSGTPHFMSPERCEGLPPSVGGDLYSAGATVYAAIAGEPPFMRPSVAAILAAQVSDTPPDLATRVPGAEKDVLSLVSLLMAKSPAKRPPDARTALAILARKDRPRSKTLMIKSASDEGQIALATTPSPDATLPAPAPEEPPAPPGTKTTKRKAHEYVEEWGKHAALGRRRIPWLRAVLPLLVAILLVAAAALAEDKTTAQRVVLASVAGVVLLGGAIWVLAGTIPAGLSDHAVALTLLDRVPLRWSVWWNKKSNPVKAALALGQLGDLGAGEILLDAGEPALAAEEFLRAHIPLAAAIVFEKLENPIRAIETYIEAGKLDEALRVARSSGKNEEAGEFFEKGGHLDKALQCFAKAERPLRLASIYERMNKLADAAKNYELASEPLKAAELYERAGQTEDAARLYHRLGDLAKVAAAWEKTGDTINAARWRAEHELAEGRRVNAAKAFEKAGLFDRATELFLSQGQVKDALRCAEAHGDPARLAPLCARTGDFKRAAELYEKAGLHREAARCHHELGDAVAEASALERSGDALAAADVWLRADRPDDAENALTSIPKHSPERKRARAKLGELHARAGRAREAAMALDEALEGEIPTAENVNTFIECADALANSGELERAIDRLMKLNGLPFAPPTLRIRIAELEKKRAPTKSATGIASLGGKDLVGFELDRYRTTSFTGEGDLSWGYEAEHTLLKRQSELRVLKSGLDEETTEQFFVEGRAIALADHPNLPEVYDSGRTKSGVAYVALELSKDATLRQLLRQAQGPLPVQRAATIGTGLLAGLAAAHQAGVVHGEIKPENILVGRGDHVRLVRFAFARSAPPAAAVAGLPFLALKAYASPEQIVGSAPGPASDQYSCGVILYEMLAGIHPFAGVTDPKVRPTAQARQLDEVAPTVPAALAGAIMKALSTDTLERFASVEELLKVVARFGNVLVAV